MQPGRYVSNEIAHYPHVRDANACQNQCQQRLDCHYWSFYEGIDGLCMIHNKFAPYDWDFYPTTYRGPRVCQQGKQ